MIAKTPQILVSVWPSYRE